MRQLRQLEKTEALTASEAILAYGLNWQVEKKPVFVDGQEALDFRAIVRQDSGYIFQIAGTRYEPIQNAEAFRFADEIIGTGGAKYVSGGSYKNGGVVYLRIALPESNFEVTPGDTIKTYLKIVTSHDGSHKLQIFPEVYRQVCTNGLHAWVKDHAKTIAVKHTENAGARFVFNAKNVLSSEIAYFEKFSASCRELAKKQFSELALDSFLNNLFEIDSSKEVSGKTKAQIERVKELTRIGTGVDIDGVKGTAWGVYQAVTEYVDNYRASRAEDGNTEKQEENREYSAEFGSGRDLRERAFELLLKA